MPITVVFGGARSGKSGFAQHIVEKSIVTNNIPPSTVVYIATARAVDSEMEARIAHHRQNRPAEWQTLEAPVDILGTLESFMATERPGIVLLDCVTIWIANLLIENDDSEIEPTIIGQVQCLLDLLLNEGLEAVIVSNELGLGLVPPSPMGREYRDLAGRVNQLLATSADRVYLTIAGIPLDLNELRCRL